MQSKYATAALRSTHTHLVEAVVTGGASSRQEPPRAAGEHEVRGGLGGVGGGERAGQEVVHHALPDAYLLRGALEHVEQQGDEPQQHQLCVRFVWPSAQEASRR